jgi:hypothetical protein
MQLFIRGIDDIGFALFSFIAFIFHALFLLFHRIILIILQLNTSLKFSLGLHL